MPKTRPATNPVEERIDAGFGARALSVEPTTLNDEERSVEAVLSTETAVPMFDYERWQTIPEVLLTDGMEVPANRQVPLLDSHARWSVGDVIGSVREIRKTGGQVRVRNYFAKSAAEAYEKVRDGHVTDMSAGYTVLERTHVPKDQKQTIAGREYLGPVNVVTRWRLKEGSLVPIGADEMAKLRGYDPQTMRHGREDLKEWSMPPELRAFLEARGMPAGLSEDDARKWADANKEVKPEAKPEEKRADPAAETPAEIAARAAREAVAMVLDQQAKKAAELKAFKEEVRANCELLKIADISGRYETVVPMAEARAVMAEEVAKKDGQGPSPFFGYGEAGRDKFRSAAGTALVMRCIGNTNEATLKKVFPEDQRAKDQAEFRNASLFDIAAACLRQDGFNARGLTREQIAIAALGFPDQVGLRAAGDPGAYHVTGSFPNLTRDAINKSMMVGYTEAPSTWRGPMRQGSSVSDFKQINRLRVGAVPNIPVWPDNTDPSALSFADAREPYAVEAYSAELSFSYRLLVNDDMDALSRLPQQMGNAMARTLNKAAWSVVTANPTMSDGQALFLTAATGNRKRANALSGAGTPTVANVQSLGVLIRLMRGENTPENNEGDDILGLMPRYIIGPAALETTINQLVNSAYDPASGVNHQVYNPTRTLMPVIEPLLDANSSTAWYLFADPSQIDTIEVTFLQGQESPVTRFDVNTKNLSQVYYVLQSFGVAALNHRGVARHAGA